MASLSENATAQKRSGPVERLRLFTGGLNMSTHTRKLAIAATIVVAAVFGLHFLVGSPVGTGVAWADVLANVEAAKTVMYRWEYEKNDEIEVAVIRFKEPYLRRSDIVQGSGTYDVTVTDTSKGECMNFYPRTKTVVVGNDIGYAAGYRFRTYERLKMGLRDGTEKELGRTTLNGREVVCFEISTEHGKTTVWADPDTALPIQIETLSDEHGGTRSLLSEIEFDIELDDGLFEPPADYSILDLETQELTTPFELTEQHLLEGLAVYPRYLNGRFPTRYIGGRPLTDEVRAKCKADVKLLDWSEMEGHKSTLGCAFIEQLPDGSDYQYVGEDVQLGDGSKAVCWYKPVDSKTYRVVYGDLSVRDVKPENLPPIPWETQEK
jgi:outer membrane lipoprotein-sorting protein